MKHFGKIAVLTVLGLLEIVFLSWALASNLPRRESELAAFTRYQSAQTPENMEQWLKERQVSEREVILRKSVGYFLVVGNLCLIVYLGRRRVRQPSDLP